jgi:hypothetical protein
LDRAKDQLQNMKRNPDNQYYVSLRKYLELRLVEVKNLLVDTEEDRDIHKLQGRAKELNEFLKALLRRPVADNQHTGSFN